MNIKSHFLTINILLFLSLFLSCKQGNVTVINELTCSSTKMNCFTFTTDEKPFNTYVSITSKDKPDINNGNVLIIEGNDVEVKWISPLSLKVTYRGTVISKKSVVNGVNISFIHKNKR